MRNVVGIDAGGTLTKIAYFNEMNKLVFENFIHMNKKELKNGFIIIIQLHNYALQVVKLHS